MKTLMERPRTKPIAGQLSLIGDPPVTFCRRCGRRLRDQRSITCGYGPTCWERVHSSNNQEEGDR